MRTRSGNRSTRAFSVAMFTLAALTPSSLSSARSTVCAHEAQCNPSIVSTARCGRDRTRYPALSTAWPSCCRSARPRSYSTTARSAARLTLASWTPGTESNARSTCCTQEAQCIPSISRVSVATPLSASRSSVRIARSSVRSRLTLRSLIFSMRDAIRQDRGHTYLRAFRLLSLTEKPAGARASLRRRPAPGIAGSRTASGG